MKSSPFEKRSLSTNRKINSLLVMVIFLSTLVRGYFAWALELGNDEVYYWTYALYPDLSHFDHPPMVGFTIQAFSWNLYFGSELFIRLGSVILGGVNTWLIFLIGMSVKDRLTGFFAALLYNASVYCFVIAGIFILPDTPQLFFWLLSLLLLIRVLPEKVPSKRARYTLFYTGIVIGLAMLSKYTSVFIWLGAGLYILFFNRQWLLKNELYLSVLLSLIVFTPVVLWNIENKFISFTFQSERVSFFGSGIRPDYFFTELFGQILYNNPINFLIIITALLALIRKKVDIDKQKLHILLLTSLPLILLFLFFALFRRTLPHWTGPAYLGLIVIAAAYLSGKRQKSGKHQLFPAIIVSSLFILLLSLSVGLFEIKKGLFIENYSKDPTRLGKNDFTLDMYGWHQFTEKASAIIDADFYDGIMQADAPIISHRWFPAAHLDYYLAKPHGYNFLALGSLEQIHKYAWINRENPGLQVGSDAYFITNSRDFQDPNELFQFNFLSIEEPITIKIFKENQHVENFFIYRMKNCYQVPPDVLEEFGIPMPVVEEMDYSSDSLSIEEIETDTVRDVFW